MIERLRRLVGVKEQREHARHRPGHVVRAGRVVGVVRVLRGVDVTRKVSRPGRILRQDVAVLAASSNGVAGPPEVVLLLGAPCADERVGHGHVRQREEPGPIAEGGHTVSEQIRVGQVLEQPIVLIQDVARVDSSNQRLRSVPRCQSRTRMPSLRCSFQRTRSWSMLAAGGPPSVEAVERERCHILGPRRDHPGRAGIRPPLPGARAAGWSNGGNVVGKLPSPFATCENVLRGGVSHEVACVQCPPEYGAGNEAASTCHSRPANDGSLSETEPPVERPSPQRRPRIPKRPGIAEANGSKRLSYACAASCIAACTMARSTPDGCRVRPDDRPHTIGSAFAVPLGDDICRRRGGQCQCCTENEQGSPCLAKHGEHSF